jgi:probable rRNA maturation factor
MKVIYSWQQPKLTVPNRKKIKLLINRIAQLANLKLSEASLLSVIFPTPKIMIKINEDFLNHDYLTDVICFNYGHDSDAEDEVAAEIFISPDIALSRAEDDEYISYASELVLYLVHGTLHLTGMMDTTSAQKKKMRLKEASIIAQLRKEFIFSDIFPEHGYMVK